MKRKNVTALIALAAMVVLTGCFKPMMNRVDMHIAPDISKAQDTFTVITAKQNPRLLMAEGIQDSVSWPAYVYEKSGKVHQLYAVNPNIKQNRLRMDILYPLGAIDVRYAVIFDRLGKTAYNIAGQGKLVKKLKDFKPADYGEFFAVGAASVKFIKKGTTEYQELAAEYGREFMSNGGKELLAEFGLKYKAELEACDYNLPEKRMRQIVKEDSRAQALTDFLRRGWYLYATFPFIGAEETAIVAGIVKIIQVPTIFEDKIDLPGYGTYKPVAMDTAEIVELGFEIYGGGKSVKKEAADRPLPDNIKAAIKGTPCERAGTYGAYNACVTEYNAAALREKGR